MKAVVVLALLLCVAYAEFSASPLNRKAKNEDIINYWTRERRDRAIDLDVIERHGSPSPPSSARDAPDAEEDPIFGEGGAPNPGANVGGEEGVPVFDIPNSNHSKRYPFPFTSGYAPSYTTNPWNLVGKVFFTQNGRNYVCSGAVIRPYVISTAGHCVFDGITPANGWSYNFVFYPGYNNGNAPYGAWPYYQLWAKNEWTQYGSFCKDYAIAILNKNSAGYGIGQWLGYFGYLYGGSTNLRWRSLGYPQAAPFNGAWNYYADSNLGVIDSSCGGRCGSSCSPATLGIGSDTTGGASGGPWIYLWGSSNYLNGVNSYKYNSQPGAIYGPYFDSDWFNLLTTTTAITPP